MFREGKLHGNNQKAEENLIKTGYASDFSKKRPRPSDSGTVILITRLPPYGWVDKDEWIQVLSPKPKTLFRWLDSKQTEEDWKIYLNDFEQEMKASEPVAAINKLRQRVRNGETITLLCYCKPEAHCHRYTVKSLIEESIFYALT